MAICDRLPGGLLSDLNSGLVVPPMPTAQAPLPAARLNPLFEIEGAPHVMATQFAAAIPSAELGDRVISLEDQALTIGNALDMLICGF
jgi:toxin CcdB